MNHRLFRHAAALAALLVLVAISGCSGEPMPTSLSDELQPTALAAETQLPPAAVSKKPSPPRSALAAARPAPSGGDWPQFRGPQGLGLGQTTGLPTTWSDEENLVWKTELPGAGTSSPVIYGDRIYLTAYTGYGVSPDDPGDMDDLRRMLLCINRKDGQVLWQKEVQSTLPEGEYGRRMHLHGYASSTPAVDEEGVYCFFGKSGLVAFDHDGNQRWQTRVGDNTHEWGSAASPVLYKDLVIVNAFVECGSLVAVNKNTGQEAWRTGGLKESWNTPLLVQLPGGKHELAVANMGRIMGVDPATGEELWTCKSMDWYIVGSMVAHEGTIYCLAGKGVEATLAVRAGGRGDVTETHVVWRAKKGSNVSSPVYFDGHLYFAHESQGIAYCLDAATGDVEYEQRLNRIGEIYASPLVADGKLYYVSRHQGAVVLAAQPEFEQLAHNRLESDRSVFNASPAASRGQLFLRSDRYLYCIGKE